MCVQCVLTGTHEGEFLGIAPTGRRVELDLCLVFRFGGDGLVDEEVIYSDGGAMLQQLGVLPEA
jgi:predicted ester cyclase